MPNGAQLSDWRDEANKRMLQTYMIDLDDIGLSEDEIDVYSRSHPDPRGFVEWFGEKYDLTPVSEFLRITRR